jgi:hypothetical protein
MTRRLWPPWSIEDIGDAFVVASKDRLLRGGVGG